VSQWVLRPVFEKLVFAQPVFEKLVFAQLGPRQ
jgi:hypothetical protein